MSAAKTSTQRVREARERRAAAGLVRLELWAHPGDHAALKEHAERLRRRRERATKKETKPPA